MKICLKVESTEHLATIIALNIIDSIIITEEFFNSLDDDSIKLFSLLPSNVSIIFDCFDENHPIDMIDIMKTKIIKIVEKLGPRIIIFPIKLDLDGFRVLNQIKLYGKLKINTLSVVDIMSENYLMKINTAFELETDIILLEQMSFLEDDKLEIKLKKIREIRNAGYYKTRLMSDDTINENTEILMIDGKKFYEKLL